MSEDEKILQIGNAVSQYSEAKTAVAHGEQRLVSIAENFEKVAKVISARTGKEFGTVDSVISDFGGTRIGDGAYALSLPDGGKLTQYVKDHVRNIQEVAELRKSLQRLGLGNID